MAVIKFCLFCFFCIHGALFFADAQKNQKKIFTLSPDDRLEFYNDGINYNKRRFDL